MGWNRFQRRQYSWNIGKLDIKKYNFFLKKVLTNARTCAIIKTVEKDLELV